MSLSSLFGEEPQYSEEEISKERRRRIRVSIWAYAYEIEHNPLVDDATYDRESYLIDVSIPTGHEILDQFFKDKFSPDTGMWIEEHPELEKLRERYQKVIRWVNEK